MEKQLPDDFREFLKLCNKKRVKYLLIGGYAVGQHGYSRATMDMDVWVESSPANAPKIVSALKEFGFDVENLREELFLQPDQIVRMGIPPLRLELLTSISGVSFGPCYKARDRFRIDGIRVDVISFLDLLINKRASGRSKDLNDLEHLEE